MTTLNTAPRFNPISDGKTIFDVGGDYDQGRSVRVQADGKILVAGTSYNIGTGSCDFSVIRLNADGTLDTSFSGDGKVIVNIGEVDIGYSLAVQADGKILVAGTDSYADFSVIRLNADGTLDTSFSDDGKFIVDELSGENISYSVTVQADGKILMAGTKDQNFGVIRLNANGTLDTSFNGNGKVSVDIGFINDYSLDYGFSLAVQADGKILVSGVSYKYGSGEIVQPDFSVIRLNADGTLDTSFSGDGKATFDIEENDTGLGMSLQADGKILLVGASGSDPGHLSMIRLNPNGTLDTTFSGDGKVIVDIDGMNNFGRSVSVQADGKILAAGSCWNKSGDRDFSVIRLNADGTLDTSFSGDGKATFDIGKYGSDGFSLTLQADGKILVAGTSHSTDYNISGSDSGSGSDFALIRLNADGTLDATFGDLGDGASYTEGAAPVALDASVAVYDAELAALDGGAGNYSGASVTFSRHGGASSEDVFSGLGNLILSNGSVLLSTSTVGIFTQVNGALTLTFSGQATQALVNEVLSSIGYANMSDTPPASVQIDWLFSDGNAGAQGSGGALSVANSTILHITAINDAPTGSVFISGTPGLSQTLRASNTLADADGLGTISYQWLRGGAAITGATGASYTLTSADTNRPISVRAIYTDSLGTAESVTSSLWVKGSDWNDILLGDNGNDTLDGGLGADRMRGGAGNDTYCVDNPGDSVFEDMGAGTDRVNSSLDSYTLGADVENGRVMASGAANLTGNSLNNVLYAGLGNNVLDGGADTDTVSYHYATSGVTVSLAQTMAQATGGSGSDTLVSVENLNGSTYNDSLIGNTGNNALNGGAGNDALSGGAGNDTLKGGAGVDTMTGGDGNDTYHVDNTLDSVVENPFGSRDTYPVLGNGGTDQVYSALSTYTLSANVENGTIVTTTGASLSGNTSDNVLAGGAGDDTLDGGWGNDSLTGGAGHDKLVGNWGNDTLIGGAGNDLLYGGEGSNTLNGGDGSDTYYVDNPLDTVIETNATVSIGGVDWVYAHVYTYTLAANVENGRMMRDANSSLTGNSLNNVLSCGYGNDRLNGDGGNDTLNGSVGDDTLDGGKGADMMTGEIGSDTYYVDDLGDRIIEADDSGFAPIDIDTSSWSGWTDTVHSYLLSYTLAANVENGSIMLDTGASLTGTSLNNVLTGNAGNDTLKGGLGNDSLSGSAGSDILNGGVGVDTMTGGDGSDTYYVDNLGDTVIEETGALSGTDRINSYLGSYTLGATIENGGIVATGTASLTGNSLNNILYAGSGGNVLDGYSGTDTVSYLYASAAVTVSLATTTAQATGGSGSDTLLHVERLTGSNYADSVTGNTGSNALHGGAGNDILNGGAGNDLLIGGLGADRLTGGTGADRFDFNVLTELGLSSTTRDTILDFKASEADKIDLLAVDANSALAGDQAFAFLGSLGAFSGDATGKLRFDAVNHILYGSTDADTTAEFAIALTGVSSLTSADLVL